MGGEKNRFRNSPFRFQNMEVIAARAVHEILFDSSIVADYVLEVSVERRGHDALNRLSEFPPELRVQFIFVCHFAY